VALSTSSGAGAIVGAIATRDSQLERGLAAAEEIVREIGRRQDEGRA